MKFNGSKQAGKNVSFIGDAPDDLTEISIDKLIKIVRLPAWDDAASLVCRRFPTLVGALLESYPSPSAACRCALLQGQAFVEGAEELHQIVTEYGEVRQKLLFEANDSELEWWAERMKKCLIKTYPGRRNIYYFDIDNKVFFLGLTTQTDVTSNVLAVVYMTKSLLTSSQVPDQVRNALQRTVLEPWTEFLEENMAKLNQFLIQ